MAKSTTQTTPPGSTVLGSTPPGTLPPITPPAREPEATVTPPDTSGPLKQTTATATATVQDVVQPNIGPSGEPRSATIEAATVSPVRFGFDLAGAAPRQSEPSYAGSLPATARVMAGGRMVALSAKSEDRTEREFTTVMRILRSGTLYEPGAPVPLTRSEFEAKRDGGSIVERLWEDGYDLSRDAPAI